MLARLLRVSLVVEVLLWMLWVSLLARLLGWNLGQAAWALLALFLGARAGIIAITYAYAWTYRMARDKSRQVGPLRAAAMMLEECFAYLALFALIQPFERALMGNDRLRRLEKDQVPLLLVHGFGCNRGSWWWLRRRLERSGHCVATVNLEPVFTGIDDYVDIIAARVRAVGRETGAQRLMLVGHSMGGLACRAYLAQHGAGQVARLLTLGTPHRGSEIARIGYGRNVRQMQPDSPWLRALAQREQGGIAATAVLSLHDNFVMPQAPQHPEGWPVREVIGLGHLAMLFSPRIAAQIEAAASQPNP